MKSINRNLRLISLIIAFFCIGVVILVVKIYRESSFYIINSNSAVLGYVYDRRDNILFDQNADPAKYGYDYFTDVANVIGTDTNQMTNTIVSENLQYLNNYTFSYGSKGSEGQCSIHSTLDHEANRAVYDSFQGKNGAAIAYNYMNGDVYICVSRPGLNPFNGYTDLEDGSLLNKNFYKFPPGSTQKIATLIAARENMSENLLNSKSYECKGSYINAYNQHIDCHSDYGHGVQNIAQGFANSCNPFFAQLVADPDFSLDGTIGSLRDLGYSVNGSTPMKLEINNMTVQTASTELTDKNEFSTQWGYIGQGKTMVSPCMLMMWQSAIANGTGTATKPHLISYTTRIDGTVDNKAVTEYTGKLFKSDTAAYVRNIMVSNGANYSSSIPGYSLGIKSGTAQMKDGKEENSLLTGFDTNPDHPIAFCVLIEDRKPGEVRTDDIVYKILSSL